MKNDKNKDFVDVKQKNRTLTFPAADLRVILPFGVGVTRDNSFFELRKAKTGTTVLATRKTNSSDAIQIYPSYSAVDAISLQSGKEPVKVKFWVVQTDLDRFRARQLIERVHYLMPTARGLFLACALVEGADDRKPQIIGVAVLDALYHGNPKDGRALFATEALGNKRWLDWPRDRIVNHFRIAWASRFAVQSKYQGCGLGTRLAVHLKTVARHFRSPAAHFLEVITTERRLGKTEKPGQRGNFLLRAGYNRLEEPMKSSPLRLLNLETGYLDGVPAEKHYYYSDLRDDD
jgi:GNAT superfamily N-acetyltransferase